jgi:hypothetical protein
MLTKNDMKILKFMNEHGSITINQCYKLFFNHAKYGHDLARKCLKALYDMGECKYTTLKNSTSLERIYYVVKPYSAHSLYLMDFYANLVSSGAEIIEFKKEYVQPNLRSDAFVIFKYKGSKVLAFIEVVLTHQVNYERYEALKDTFDLQRQYGIFPMLFIISGVPDRYKGNKLVVKYLDYNLSEFNKIVLP